jgi:glycosyltransferase involved in cell wall biosynthesis
MMAKTTGIESAFKLGAIVPTYRHVERLPGIVQRLVNMGLPVIVVDDGNAEDYAQRIAALHRPESGVFVLRRPVNGGKGAAMADGFEEAARQGWSHAFQIDADGQHDLGCVPDFVALAQSNPTAVVCGVPVYDHTIPKARKFGREITHFWVRIETLSRAISDSLCGFRIYPVAPAVDVMRREIIGRRMDFDVEIVVHLYWRGLPIVEGKVGVTYPPGNVSNFDLLKDNVRISAMHTRLVVQMPFRMPIMLARRALANR